MFSQVEPLKVNVDKDMLEKSKLLSLFINHQMCGLFGV